MDVRYEDLLFGITTIDTGLLRPGFTASHLIVEFGEAAFVDVGPATTLPTLLAVLDRKQIAREQVKYLIVTHVHLDHAGGVGTLLRELPNAQVVVHPKGARHLIAPQRLAAGAAKVYGEDYIKSLFGEMLPVPEDRVIKAEHGFCLVLNGRPLVFLDTPGHARHHCCVYDERSRGVFTGDVFGISFREFDTDKGNFILPATAPVQFEPDAMHASIELILKYHPLSLYLTHFGCITDVHKSADDLHGWIAQFVQLARSVETSDQERHAELLRRLEQLVLSRLQAHGCQLSEEQMLALLKEDFELDVQGIEVWLDRLKKHQKDEEKG